MHLFTQKIDQSGRAKHAPAKISTRDLAIFSVLGSIMFVSRIAMQWIPQVHLLGLFIAAITLTYRVRALIPLYVYILLDVAFSGLILWPYLYIWLPLWLMFMLIGKLELPRKIQIPLYMALCALHGLSFGTLFAPAWMLMGRLNFKTIIAWIVAGLLWDVTHAIGNFVAGTLIIPLSSLLKKLDSQNGQ